MLQMVRESLLYDVVYSWRAAGWLADVVVSILYFQDVYLANSTHKVARNKHKMISSISKSETY